MGFFDSLLGMFSTTGIATDAPATSAEPEVMSPVDSLGSRTGYSDSVNPETGLPLFGDGNGAIDIGGSPLGFDNHSSFNSSSE